MMEPSGDAFNSILKLDTASNRPFNPMINAGAIEVVSLLAGRFSFEQMLEFIRTLCNDNEIVLDESVYRSEKATGDRVVGTTVTIGMAKKKVGTANPAASGRPCRS